MHYLKLYSACMDMLLLLLLLLLLLHLFNDLFSRTTWVSRYQKGKTSLDLNEARDDGVWGWQWHQLDHMQTICTSLQTDNHTNTSLLNFLQAGCSSWRSTNSVKSTEGIIMASRSIKHEQYEPVLHTCELTGQRSHSWSAISDMHSFFLNT